MPRIINFNSNVFFQYKIVKYVHQLTYKKEANLKEILSMDDHDGNFFRNFLLLILDDNIPMNAFNQILTSVNSICFSVQSLNIFCDVILREKSGLYNNHTINTKYMKIYKILTLSIDFTEHLSTLLEFYIKIFRSIKFPVLLAESGDSEMFFHCLKKDFNLLLLNVTDRTDVYQRISINENILLLNSNFLFDEYFKKEICKTSSYLSRIVVFDKLNDTPSLIRTINEYFNKVIFTSQYYEQCIQLQKFTAGYNIRDKYVYILDNKIKEKPLNFINHLLHDQHIASIIHQFIISNNLFLTDTYFCYFLLMLENWQNTNWIIEKGLRIYWGQFYLKKNFPKIINSCIFPNLLIKIIKITYDSNFSNEFLLINSLDDKNIVVFVEIICNSELSKSLRTKYLELLLASKRLKFTQLLEILNILKKTRNDDSNLVSESLNSFERNDININNKIQYDLFHKMFIKSEYMEKYYYEISNILWKIIISTAFSSTDSSEMNYNSTDSYYVEQIKDEKQIKNYLLAYMKFIKDHKNNHIMNSMMNLNGLLNFDDNIFPSLIENLKAKSSLSDPDIILSLICYIPFLKPFKIQHLDIILQVDSAYTKEVILLLCHIINDTEIDRNIISKIVEYIKNIDVFNNPHYKLDEEYKSNNPLILYRIYISYHIYVICRLMNYHLDNILIDLFIQSIDDIIDYITCYLTRNELVCLELFEELLISSPNVFFDYWISFLSSENFLKAFSIIKSRYLFCQKQAEIHLTEEKYISINFGSMMKRILMYENDIRKTSVNYFDDKTVDEKISEMKQMYKTATYYFD